MEQADYLQIVEQIVDEQLKSSPQIKASALGVILRDRGLHWTQYGFSKLKHVLITLSASSNIQVGPDRTSALSVWRVDSAEQHEPSTQDITLWVNQSLKTSIWNAFVIESTTEKHWINRQTGLTWLSPDEPPQDLAMWVEVEPIPNSLQQEWAKEFVRAKKLDDQAELDFVINSEEWYRAFPSSLGHLHISLRRSWNRERTRRANKHILGWCQQNEISPHLLYEQRSDPKHVSSQHLNGSDKLRNKILQMINQMSTEDLLEMRLPARILAQSLRSNG